MDIITTLLVAGFFFIMGALVVGLVWYLQNVSRKIRNKNAPTPPEDPNLAELTRLMRHLQTQDLVVMMDNKFFKAGRELSPAQYRRLTFISNVLTKWLAQSAPAPEAEAAATALPAESVAGEPAVPTGAVPAEGQLEAPAGAFSAEAFSAEASVPAPGAAITSPEAVDAPPDSFTTDELMPGTPEAFSAETAHAYTPPFAGEAVEEIKPVSTDLPDVVNGMLNPAVKPAPAFKSIAEQINDILQQQMVGTPLEGRGIVLSDAPDHGVMVTLDGRQFGGVMDVPDEDVRAAIKAAVVEWETRK